MQVTCEESVPGEADETRERRKDREEPRHVKGGSSLTLWGGLWGAPTRLEARQLGCHLQASPVSA